MNSGEIALLVMLGVSLLISAYMHGKPEKGSHNFWIDLISVFLTFALMKWAGLF